MAHAPATIPCFEATTGAAACAVPVPKTLVKPKTLLDLNLNRLRGSPLSTPTTKSADSACGVSPKNCTRQWNLP